MRQAARIHSQRSMHRRSWNKFVRPKPSLPERIDVCHKGTCIRLLLAPSTLHPVPSWTREE